MYAKRANEKTLEDSIKSPFITAILGPRRVGKTAFVYHYAQENQAKRKWVFLNMDELSENDRVENRELQAMIEEAAEQKIGAQQTPIWVAIDEAQKSPALFHQIKVLYDRFKDTGAIKFILTGSGFLTLHKLTSETLAGRIHIHYLREFSLREAARLKTSASLPDESFLDALSQGPEAWAQIVDRAKPFRKSHEAALEELLIWGGMPEVLLEAQENQRLSYFSSYLQTYFEKDIRGLELVSDLPLYRKLLEIVAEQTGSVRNDDRFLAALACARGTLKKYRSILEATLFYTEVYPFIGSSLKRLTKSPKGYLTNNGLISYLTGLHDIKLLEKSGLIGHRFENWFLKELLVWLDRNYKHSEVAYWRTSGGVEVDFVVERPPEVFPFEVTYGHQPQPQKVKKLKQFLAEEPKAKWGFYVYQGDYKIDEEARIFFIPYWAIS